MTLAHSYGWHRLKLIGPLSPPNPDGKNWQHKCEWCGLRIPVNGIAFVPNDFFLCK